MAQLIIVRGLPGSGKTTVAKAMTGFIHCEADEFMVDDEGKYKFDKDRLPACHRLCEMKVSKHLALGHDVVVSNTFCKLWELAAYLRMASDLDISPLIVECKGLFQNQHGVPDYAIERMRRSWQPIPMFPYSTKGEKHEDEEERAAQRVQPNHNSVISHDPQGTAGAND